MILFVRALSAHPSSERPTAGGDASLVVCKEQSRASSRLTRESDRRAAVELINRASFNPVAIGG